ncbi:hypothetical protein HKBW3S34_02455, partial [Candidatus Hakubella thermalkaliphila]
KTDAQVYLAMHDLLLAGLQAMGETSVTEPFPSRDRRLFMVEKQSLEKEKLAILDLPWASEARIRLR